MKDITASELCEALKSADEKSIFLDVRTREEHIEKNIPGVKNIPLNELQKHVEELRNFDRIYIHCAKGGRSKTACEYLYFLGLHYVFNVEGGIEAWENCQNK